MTPWVVADTALLGPVAIPTSDAPGPAVSKKTRSPAAICDRGTLVPVPNWAKLVRGRWMPAWPNAQKTRPEQSKPLGPVDPARYGAPILVIAAARAACAPL